MSGTIVVCPTGLEECNNEFAKSQIKKIGKSQATQLSQDALHMGALVENRYNKETGEKIMYREKRYFEYFGLANFEGCKLVIKRPSALVRLQFDKLAKLGNVTLMSFPDFVTLVNT